MVSLSNVGKDGVQRRVRPGETVLYVSVKDQDQRNLRLRSSFNGQDNDSLISGYRLYWITPEDRRNYGLNYYFTQEVVVPGFRGSPAPQPRRVS